MTSTHFDTFMHSVMEGMSEREQTKLHWRTFVELAVVLVLLSSFLGGGMVSTKCRRFELSEFLVWFKHSKALSLLVTNINFHTDEQYCGSRRLCERALSCQFSLVETCQFKRF